MHVVETKKKIRVLDLAVFLAVIFLITTACQVGGEVTNTPDSSSEETQLPTRVEPYPSPTETEAYPSGYPGPESAYDQSFESEPPQADLDLPAAQGVSGVVGGVLILEEPGKGYAVLEPLEFTLGKVLAIEDGGPGYIRTGSDSPLAQFLPAGVFIFQDVPPGEYGLVVNLGYTQFPINGDDDNPMIITIEQGQALNLGQVITRLPGS